MSFQAQVPLADCHWIIGYRHETLRQDVGQDDCGLNILNKRQRVGIIYIYYYQVANFIQRWNCICAMACFKINENIKRVMMFQFVALNV